MKKIYLLAFVCSVLTASSQAPAGAAGYWPFDNNALDVSGNGNNGTATNTIPYKDRFGNPNKAYKFNGQNSGIVVPNSITVDIGANQDFTFSFWEKSYADNVNRTIVAKHIMGGWDGYWFGAYVGDQGYCNVPQHIDFYTASGGQEDACSNTGIMSDSTWHLITGVYKASIQSNYLYIDGVLQADSGKSSGTLSNTASLTFGFFPSVGNYFHGVLDEGRLYKRALSPAEIMQLYNEGTVPAGLQQWNNPAVKVQVAPNPGIGLFNVSVSNGTCNMGLEVCDVLGRLVWQQALNSVNTLIDIQEQPAGIYYLKLKVPQGQQVLKLIKD